MNTIRRKATAAGQQQQRDLPSWIGLGIDMISEEDGGMPLILALGVAYFQEKRCFGSAGLLKQPGNPDTVNRILESFVGASFSSFDALEATYLGEFTSSHSCPIFISHSWVV